MANDYDVSAYRRENLESILTPAQYMEYLSLNSQFRSLFGEQNFGDFDYYAYLTDTNYQRGVNNQLDPNLAPGTADVQARQQIMNQLTSFFQNIASGRFEPVDIKGIYEGAGGYIGQIGAEQLARRESEMSRQTQQAARELSREYARMGIARSGAAEMALSGLEKERLRLWDEAQSEIRQWEATQLAALDTHIRDLEVQAASEARRTYGQYLSEFEAWQRDLMTMAYQEGFGQGTDYSSYIASLGNLAMAIGSIMAACTAELKMDIKDLPLERAMKLVRVLKPRCFRWKESGRSDVGFIAEEVAHEMPAAAILEGTKVMGVQYHSLIPVLFAVCRGLLERLDKLEEELFGGQKHETPPGDGS